MMRKLCGLQALAVGMALCPILCSAQADNPTKQGAFSPTWEELSPVDPTKATTAQTNWENFIPDDPAKATRAQQAQPQRHGFHFDANGNPIDQVAGKVEPNPFDQFVNATQPASQSSVQEPREVDWATESSSKKPAGNLIDRDALPVVKPNSLQNDPVAFSLGNVAVGILLAFAVCFSVFWALGKSVRGSTPVATGRRWMNWVIPITLIQPLTTTFSFSLHGTGNPGVVLVQGVLAAVVFGIAAFASGALWAHSRRRQPIVGPFKEIRPSSAPTFDVQLPTPRPKSSSSTSQTIDEGAWEAALTEFDTGNRRPGLWAMMFSAADGNESLAKARYLQARVTELEAEREALASQRTLDAKRNAKELELAHLTEEERAEALRPKGICPNCDAIIALASATCPRCRATFGNEAAWKVAPIPNA